MLHDMQLMQHRGACNISRDPLDCQLWSETNNDNDNYISRNPLNSQMGPETDNDSDSDSDI